MSAARRYRNSTPFAVIQHAVGSLNLRRAVVSISCGKDSVATLDVCSRHFQSSSSRSSSTPALVGLFCYVVPGLSFQENYLDYLSRRYSISILRLPLPDLATRYKSSLFRHPTAASRKAPSLAQRDVFNYVRSKTGIEWIATGEKAIDSPHRNAMIRNVDGIDESRRVFFPLAYWSERAVYSYLRTRNLSLAPDYRLFHSGRKADHNFALFNPAHLVAIRSAYPDDYRRILAHFPLLETLVVKHERELERQQREGHDHDGKNIDAAQVPIATSAETGDGREIASRNSRGSGRRRSAEPESAAVA